MRWVRDESGNKNAGCFLNKGIRQSGREAAHRCSKRKIRSELSEADAWRNLAGQAENTNWLDKKHES